MTDVGYCEHPDHPEPDEPGGEANATNRVGDQFICDEHLPDAVGDDDAIIRIVFTVSDIESLVEEYNENREDGAPALTLAEGLERAWEWARPISDTAVGLCNEQLERAVTTGCV